jgi:hypothetical protein
MGQQSARPSGYGMPGMPPPRRAPRKGNRNRNTILLAIAAFAVLGVIVYAINPNGVNGAAHPASSSTTASATPVTASRAVAPSPAAAHKRSFPPTTLTGFRAFAAKGDASRVEQIATRTEGLPSCPDPNIDVAVKPGLTGKALEADLAAFFVQSGLLDNQCQAFVFAFHSKSDYEAHQNDGFTVGRVALTANSGSGPQHNLEVDAGNVANVQAQFNFNF